MTAVFPADWRRFLAIAVLGIVGLNIADIWLTQLLLAGTTSREANPLLAPVAGTPWALVVKVALPMFLAVWNLRRTDACDPAETRRRALSVGFATILYLSVVAWNLHLVTLRVIA